MTHSGYSRCLPSFQSSHLWVPEPILNLQETCRYSGDPEKRSNSPWRPTKIPDPGLPLPAPPLALKTGFYKTRILTPEPKTFLPTTRRVPSCPQLRHSQQPDLLLTKSSHDPGSDTAPAPGHHDHLSGIARSRGHSASVALPAPHSGPLSTSKVRGGDGVESK